MITFERKLNEEEIVAVVKFLIRDVENLTDFDNLLVNPSQDIFYRAHMARINNLSQFIIEELEIDLLSNSILISGWEFYDSLVKEITIPSNTIKIGERAFKNCENLRSITIPNSVKEIGEKAFYHCDYLIIDCYEGSYAEKYCIDNDLDYAWL